MASGRWESSRKTDGGIGEAQQMGTGRRPGRLTEVRGTGGGQQKTGKGSRNQGKLPTFIKVIQSFSAKTQSGRLVQADAYRSLERQDSRTRTPVPEQFL